MRPGDAPGLAGIFQGQADGKRGCGAQQGHRYDEEDQDGGKSSEQNRHLELVKGLGGEPQDRTGGQWNQPDSQGSPGQDAVKSTGRRGPVSPAPAQKVAHRQVNEDQADDAGPHQVAGAVDIAQQPRSRELNRQRGHPRRKYSDIQVGEVSLHGLNSTLISPFDKILRLNIPAALRATGKPDRKIQYNSDTPGLEKPG